MSYGQNVCQPTNTIQVIAKQYQTARLRVNQIQKIKKERTLKIPAHYAVVAQCKTFPKLNTNANDGHSQLRNARHALVEQNREASTSVTTWSWRESSRVTRKSTSLTTWRESSRVTRESQSHAKEVIIETHTNLLLATPAIALLLLNLIHLFLLN